MNRPISTRTHGMIDYAWATTAGMMRVMPMKGHLAIDFVMCAALMMSPFFLPRSERRYAAVPVLLGAVGFLASILTETT